MPNTIKINIQVSKKIVFIFNHGSNGWIPTSLGDILDKGYCELNKQLLITTGDCRM